MCFVRRDDDVVRGTGERVKFGVALCCTCQRLGEDRIRLGSDDLIALGEGVLFTGRRSGRIPTRIKAIGGEESCRVATRSGIGGLKV